MAGVAQLVGASSRTPGSLRFNSPSGHMPRLWVWSPIEACMQGSQSMFLSQINVSLPTPCQINKCILRQGFKKITK